MVVLTLGLPTIHWVTLSFAKIEV